VKLIVIERKAYGAVARKIGALVPMWEHGTPREP
jgi:hypothetical protein